MNDLEERLRAVTRAAGEQIPSTNVKPLQLPAGGRLRRAGWLGPLGPAGPHWRRWQARLAPLAAAAVVAGLVAGSITLAHAITAHQTSHRGRAVATAATLPPYYVTLPYSAQTDRPVPGHVLIRATTTGKLITTVSPPRGEEFTGVSGAADDATFVLSAETPAQVRYVEKHAGKTGIGLAGFTGPARFYFLHFDATTGTAQVTPLNVPAVADATWFALSADGTRLAVSTSAPHAVGLTVYWLATGAARAWTQSSYQGGEHKWFTVYVTSWTEGDKVQVDLLTPKGRSGAAGLLNTSEPGGSLLAAIHPLSPGPCSGDELDLDGNLGLGAVPSRHGIPWRLQECTFSHGRGKVTVPGRTIYYGKQTVDLSGEFWVSPDGSTILADGVAGTPQMPFTAVAGLLAGNQIKAIPGSGSIPQMDIWPGAAVSW